MYLHRQFKQMHEQEKYHTANSNIGFQGAQGKEAVLRRLLETQETYIQELEAKCKVMTDQITESPFKTANAQFQGSLQSTDIDIRALEKTQQPFVDKMQILIAHYESANRTLGDPSLKNLIEALCLLKAEASIQIEVFQQRDQQHQSLIQTLQHRFQKERQDLTHQADQTERALQQKLRLLEQELQVLKRQVTKQSVQEEDLNAEVLNELENMEARYKQSDEELRAENLHLKKQLGQVSKQSREIQSQLLTTKQKLDVKSCEEFTLLKRLEDTLKLIRGEVRQAHRFIESTETPSQNSNPEPEDQINLTVSEVPEMSLHLQKELDQAYKEIEILRQGDINDIWQQKVELVEREKKILQDEISKLSKSFLQRDTQYQRDLKQTQSQVKLLAKQQTERENQLEYELLQTKTQLRDIIGSINIQALQVVFPGQKSDQEQIGLLQSENDHLRAHNTCLRAQVQDLLIQMGRAQSIASANVIIDKVLQYSSSQNKLCSKIGDLCLRFNQTLDKVELLASDQSLNTDMSSVFQNHNDLNLVKIDSEQAFLIGQELSAAKKSLVLYINKCNNLEELLDSELQLDSNQIQRILVKKFAEEINMLKQEKTDLQQSKDQEITYYKQQIQKLFDQQSLQSSNPSFEGLKAELKQHLSDLKHLTSQLTESESKQIQAAKAQSLQKRSQQSKEINVPLNTLKSAFYEEISLLRDQVDQMQTQFQSYSFNRNAEILALEQARIHVQKREEQLATCIRSIIKSHQSKSSNTDKLAENFQQKQFQLMQSEIESLQASLKSAEQRVFQQYEEKAQIMSQKLQLVADQKDLLEQQLYQLQQRLDVQNEPKRILQHENERLRQHILVRQQEMLEMRNKTQQLQKQLKQKAHDCEKDLLKKYKDRLSSHLKVFDLELNKLQCILQEL